MKKTALALTLSFALLLPALFVSQAQAFQWNTIKVPMSPHDIRGSLSITDDGSKIAFNALVNDKCQVFVVNRDGSGLKQLADDGRVYSSPCISGDGKRIVCYSYIQKSLPDGYIYWEDYMLVAANSDGTELRSIVSVPMAFNTLLAPSISYDGTRVAFAADTSLYVVNSDGKGLTKIASSLTETLLGFSGGPSMSDDGARIVYSGNRFGGKAVFVVNSDGTGRAELAPVSGDYYGHPSISGDGSKVAFFSYSNGNYEVFVINSDGSGLKQLTHGISTNRSPSISRDGGRIAFLSDEIFVVNSDGTGLTQITDAGPDAKTDSNPPSINGDGNKIAYSDDGMIFVSLNLESGFDTASPFVAERWSRQFRIASGLKYALYLSLSGDGNKIAFVSKPREYHEVFVVNSDGTELKQLTNGIASWIMGLAFSSDGGKIAFISSWGESDFRLCIVNSDGTGLKQLFNSTMMMKDVSISGDGGVIACSCRITEDYNYAFFVFDSNGTQIARITDNVSWLSRPLLSNDGSRIMFSSRDLFTTDGFMYIVNSDGTEPRQLKLDPDWAWPTMSADWNKIAFLANDDKGEPEIYVYSTDGTQLAQVTSNLPRLIYSKDPPSVVDLHEIESPQISGDGNKIVFVSGHVFVINSDGTGLKQATDTTGSYVVPQINNDGRVIAFLSQIDGINYELYVSFNPESDYKRPVVTAPVPTASPTFASPPAYASPASSSVSLFSSESSPATLLVCSIVAVVAVAGSCLLIYLKKRREDKTL